MGVGANHAGVGANHAGVGDPLEARIVACCDAFNAMTTTRPYREAMPVSAALTELIDSAGTQFDPRVVETLLRVLGQPGGVGSISLQARPA